MNFSTLTTALADSITFTDANLLASTKYYYKVRAVKAGYRTAYAGPVNATTQKPPLQVWQENYGYEQPADRRFTISEFRRFREPES